LSFSIISNIVYVHCEQEIRKHWDFGGARFEDDVVVLKDGAESLNKGIPRTAEEIEAFKEKLLISFISFHFISTQKFKPKYSIFLIFIQSIMTSAEQFKIIFDLIFKYCMKIDNKQKAMVFIKQNQNDATVIHKIQQRFEISNHDIEMFDRTTKLYEALPYEQLEQLINTTNQQEINDIVSLMNINDNVKNNLIQLYQNNNNKLIDNEKIGEIFYKQNVQVIQQKFINLQQQFGNFKQQITNNINYIQLAENNNEIIQQINTRITNEINGINNLILGDQFLHGIGDDILYSNAIAYYNKSIQQSKNKLTQYRLAFMKYFGTGMKENDNEAIKEMLPIQNDIYHAKLYCAGYSINPTNNELQFNGNKQMEIHKELSNIGIADATNRIGYNYAKGENGIEKNENEAKKYYKQAAEMGYRSGCNNYAIRCDNTEEKQWFRKAFELNYRLAQNNWNDFSFEGAKPKQRVIEYMENGRGVKKDINKPKELKLLWNMN
jgi:TPR repeat protein